MTHRQRILATLQHRTPDRVPVDLGGTIASTLTIQAHDRLRAHLGLPAGPPRAIFARRSSTVLPDEAILQRFDIDTRAVLLGSPDVRPERELSEITLMDEWGVTWTRPAGGHYIHTAGPFYGLDEPAVQDLKKYVWPDPADPGRFRGLRERARAIHQDTDYAVILNLGVGPIHACQFLRGWSEFLTDLLVHPAFAEGLLERAVDVWIGITTRALEEAAQYVDLVIFGDDLGAQKTTLIRPELYRRMVKPHHKRMVEAVKRYGKPVIHHTCGSVYALIPDLIEVGIDVLNPIQVAAAEMDTRRLKREFGRDLSFWGAIDNQRVLPRGAPEEVRQEVRRRIEDLAEGGGYVLCAAHNLQPDVPPENTIAMYEAALEYGR
jgi:uroporphyrinogen decarboxylase